jgi:hypothetical protein
MGMQHGLTEPGKKDLCMTAQFLNALDGQLKDFHAHETLLGRLFARTEITSGVAPVRQLHINIAVSYFQDKNSHYLKQDSYKPITPAAHLYRVGCV